MATVCLRLCPVCMIPRAMTSPFKCKATLHVDVCILLYYFSLYIFLAMILVASQMTSRPKFKLWPTYEPWQTNSPQHVYRYVPENIKCKLIIFIFLSYMYCYMLHVRQGSLGALCELCRTHDSTHPARIAAPEYARCVLRGAVAIVVPKPVYNSNTVLTDIARHMETFALKMSKCLPIVLNWTLGPVTSLMLKGRCNLWSCLLLSRNMNPDP